jgi:site-specific DNA-methyltransferase (adenine-specific)
LKPSGTCWVNFGDTYANKTKDGFRTKLRGNMHDRLTKRVAFVRFDTKLSIPPKSLCLIPSRFAIRMIERGWILRNEIIWHKPNAMSQSVRDRFSVDFEKVFLFVKNRKYYFRQQFEPLKNPERIERPLLDPHKKYKCTASYWYSTRPEVSERARLKMLKKGRNKRCVWTIGTTSFAGNHFVVFPARLVETPVLAGCPPNGIVLDPFIGSGTTAEVAKKLNRNFIGIELNPEYVKLAGNRIENLKSN